MKISTKGRYALRLMIDLAQHDTDSYIALKEVAVRQNISIKYLEQIITVLCKSGFLKSLRGSQGGYKLSRSPQEYTAGEILRAIEGDLVPVACLQDEVNQCERSDICETIGFWNGLYDVINKYVDSVTLYDLAILNKGKQNIDLKTER
ncbi:MAG: Rrf2 family transcriptional regulator [Clostridiales bacterium]|jgi:Rrf2 family protein|nr:Rrf2 family transcriptional regulator [Clostridiales bacterium]